MDLPLDGVDVLDFRRVGADELSGRFDPRLEARVSLADDTVAAFNGKEVLGVAATTHERGDRDLVAWWVDPAIRGRGIGGVLLRSALDDASPRRLGVPAPATDELTAMLRAYAFEPSDDAAIWVSPSGVIRQAVRAVVTDHQDRFVLVRFEIDGIRFWNLPGGGIEPTETAPAALVRELHEELGYELTGDAIGALAWRRLHWWTHLKSDVSRPDGQLERVHLVSAPTVEFDPAIGWGGLASEFVIDIRWWRLDELASTTDRFAAADLPDRIRAALAAAGQSHTRARSSDACGPGAPGRGAFGAGGPEHGDACGPGAPGRGAFGAAGESRGGNRPGEVKR